MQELKLLREKQADEERKKNVMIIFKIWKKVFINHSFSVDQRMG